MTRYLTHLSGNAYCIVRPPSINPRKSYSGIGITPQFLTSNVNLPISSSLFRGFSWGRKSVRFSMSRVRSCCSYSVSALQRNTQRPGRVQRQKTRVNTAHYPFSSHQLQIVRRCQYIHWWMGSNMERKRIRRFLARACEFHERLLPSVRVIQRCAYRLYKKYLEN